MQVANSHIFCFFFKIIVVGLNLAAPLGGFALPNTGPNGARGGAGNLNAAAVAAAAGNYHQFPSPYTTSASNPSLAAAAAAAAVQQHMNPYGSSQLSHSPYGLPAAYGSLSHTGHTAGASGNSGSGNAGASGSSSANDQ